MKRFVTMFVAIATVAGLAVAGTATAGPPGAAPGQGKITCFTDGVLGTCTLNSGGAKGTATLNTTAGPGAVAGAFIPGYNSSFYGVRLSAVKALSFTYSGVPSLADPHWSIPIDATESGDAHDGLTDFFAAVSASSCNNGVGLVDVINDPTCTIYRNDNASVSWPNWAAFVAAMGTNTWVANDINYAFVIADSTDGGGVWTVGQLTLGKPGK